ncbi:MAG: FAD-binding oxidoreductase [Myxococcales bacterium]|nr:MAG: FAD-binding oxidoreductase [Myxococcales bacterium]
MTHDEKVRQLAASIRARAAEKGAPPAFQKASTPHLVPNPYARKNSRPTVNVAALDELLTIDAKKRIAVAESGLTFSDLVQATLKQGLLPCTVPELKGITVGGAVSGCSIEAMSYQYGGFHDSCLEYEVVTGTGEVLTLSPEQEPELFHLLHGSYGTLARLTKVTLKLLPAKPFVKMTYRRLATFGEFWSEMNAHCAKADCDFIDAIIHAKDSFVLCLGDFVDAAPFASRYDGLDLFYKSTREKTEDYLATYDYCFRYDTECHWLTATVPLLENRLVRRLAGKWFLGSTNLISWSNRLRGPLKLIKRRPDVVVDVFIPARRMEEFYAWYERDFDFYPLWIVPYRMKELYPWINPAHAERLGETLLIDCAIYGKPNGDPKLDYSELLERKVHELGGVKTLISRNHYDEATFWSIYDRERIARAKARLDPHNLFGDLYAKFAPENYR